jgi:hypothetical protein
MAVVPLGGGKVTDARTYAQHVEAQQLAGFVFRVTQGSYNGGVSASAGTHNGGGALDYSTSALSRSNKTAMVAALRRVGFAAWVRPYRAGVWTEHVHAISIQPGGRYDQGVLSRGAHSQVKSYYDGRDGLSGNGPDPHAGLGIEPITWEAYKAAQVPPPPPPPPVPAPTTRKARDMFATPYGSSYRLVTPRAVIAISAAAYTALKAAGYAVVLPIADVDTITSTLGRTE